jgi:hypothetical protein
MNKHLKYILLLLVFLGTLKQSIAQTTISSSVTLTQSVLNGYSWPVTINGGSVGSPLIVTLGEDVTFTNAQNYFIINGSYVTFEGNNKTITISGISFYKGLIKNGFYELVRTFDENFNMTQTINSTNGFNNLTIQNLGVLAVNSDVAAGQGWIGQSSFALNASNNLIINCYSNGPLRQSSGGIIGEKSYGTVKKSYSTGAQIGGWAGGIYGSESHGTAENCFSTAPSFGNRGGGIFGGEASNATATNCYSTGTINENCGGIFGGFTSSCTATNCYSTGAIGNNAGGIFGGNSSSVTATNCYIANNAWVSNDANTALTGEDGTVWNTNTSPYTLIALATLITSNTSIDQAWINKRVYNLPILLDANVTVTILEDLTFTDANCYFAVRATGVTFDGNFKKITIKDITNYRGLVNNGNYLGNNVAAISGSIVKNIGVLSNNSSLKAYCGWIGQQGYGNGAGFSITYCYSNGNMTNDGSGGILGQAFMNGTISNSYSLGNISGSYSAGIVASSNSTASKISNCYSNGSITGSNANGICEPDMMMMMYGMGGGDSFTNCYAANGNFNTTTANSKLTGTDGTVWNTSVTPYTLSAFNTITLKWGLSANGLKTQDNTIQLDINGKKGTSSPVNENGKVN